ncbi:MAG: hypothetical protein AAB447_02685 [Patescibacteria group bacterium]
MSAERLWKRSFPDRPDMIMVSARAATEVFLCQLKDSDNLEGVRKFRDGTKKAFQEIDAGYSSLCADESELISWAARAKSIIEWLDELDRHLASSGRPGFPWNRVCLTMGLLYAYRIASEQTLKLNKPPQ